MKKTSRIISIPFLILSVFSLILFSCQSSTETVTENKSKEKEPENKVTIKEIEVGIRYYIQETIKQSGGKFHVENDTLSLDLRLVRVHTEFLANLAGGTYFACTDLADEKGDIYDVDFFLDGEAGDMNVTRTDIHKLNGRPFYTWKKNKDNGTWFTVPIEDAGNKLLGVVEGKDEFVFHYSVQLPEIKGTGKMWLPIAQSTPFQDVEILSVESPVDEKYITDKKYGNRAAFLNLNAAQSGKEVTISYRVKRKEKQPYAAKEDENLVQYLQPSSLIPVNDRFKNIAKKAIRDKTKDDPIIKSRALYDYVIDSMSYIRDGEFGTGDAVYACDAKTGNCTEFHSFFIALARSVNIPARFAIGASIPSARNEGGIEGYHCWAEFYAEGKWWPVDISEANKYTALATYYFGHHGANRFEFSRGRDIQFQPQPKSGKINYFAYPILEINGEKVKPKTDFSYERKEIS